MTIKFQTVLTYRRPKRGMRKAHAEAMQKANMEGAKEWREKLFPIHFTPEAVARYGYESRTVKYQARKFRRFGHTNPLEYTGAAKAFIMNGYTIDASTGRAVVNMPSPRVFNLSQQIGHPNLRAEALRTVERDLEVIAKAAFKTYLAKMKEQEETKRKVL